MVSLCFYDDIAKLIASYCAELRLRDWISMDNLDKRTLYANPMALEAGVINIDRFSRSIPRHIARNPTIFNKIAAHRWSDYFCEASIWANPNPDVLDCLLRQSYMRIHWQQLSYNSCERAIRMLSENLDKADRIGLSTNSGAMDILRAHPDMIDRQAICANPAAIDMIKEIPDNEISGFWLTFNPHPWAIEYLCNHPEKINWHHFGANPGIFEYRAPHQLADCLKSA